MAIKKINLKKNKELRKKIKRILQKYIDLYDLPLYMEDGYKYDWDFYLITPAKYDIRTGERKVSGMSIIFAIEEYMDERFTSLREKYGRRIFDKQRKSINELGIFSGFDIIYGNGEEYDIKLIGNINELKLKRKVIRGGVNGNKDNKS